MGHLAFRILVCFALFPTVAAAAPGDLDPAFGGTGYVTTDLGTSGAEDVVVLADGRIVVAGYSGSVGARQFTLIRYNPDGSLDNTFGTGGIVTTTIGITSEAKAMLLYPDGTIVAGGSADLGSGPRFALARYDEDGALDGTFGTGGIVTTTIGTDSAIHGLALQSDGSIVAAGYRISGNRAVALARYTSGGVLDGAFGTAGIEITPVGSQSEASAIVVLSSDKLAIAGTSDDRMLVVRYQNDGDPDATFGTAGVFVHDDGEEISLEGITVRDNGRLVVVGTYESFSTVLAQLTTDGELDDSFGGGSGIYSTFGFHYFWDVIVRDDGGILVGGSAHWPGSIHSPMPYSDFLVSRFESDGQLDLEFGFAVDSFQQFDDILAIALTPDGQLVAAGRSGNVTVARYDVSLCGNGFPESPETCDDENETNGDGCDNNCTITGCGNGIVTSGETCDGGECCTAGCTGVAGGTPCSDDGNFCTTDECDGSGACGVNNSLPCDDGNVCTDPDVCVNGECSGPIAVVCPACQTCRLNEGCVDGPRPDCIGAAKALSSRLNVTAASLPEESSLSWKSPQAGMFDVAALGDPVSTDAYDVCLFSDVSPNFAALEWSAHLPAGGTCGDRPCWQTRGENGFEYRDDTASAGGVTRLSISTKGVRSKIRVEAEGSQLEVPDFYASQTPPVAIQVQRGSEACWGATFEEIRKMTEKDGTLTTKIVGD